MKKRNLLAVLLSLVMLLSILTGCSSEEANVPTPSEANPTVSEESTPSVVTDIPYHKLGFICWSYTGALEQSYKKTMEKLGEELNFDVVFAEASSNEDVLAAVENLIENGCEGILATTAPPTIMELCNQAGVYFVQYSNNVDAETQAEFEKSEYWLGYVTDNDDLAGYNGVKAMYEQGCREIGLMAPPAGMAANQDARFGGMIRAAEELGMVYHEYRGIEFVNAVQNFCTLYPELDGIFSVTAAAGLMDAYIQTIDSCGMIDQVKVGTFDIPDNADIYFAEGSYCFAAGGQFPDAELCVAVMLNALNGDRMGDGPVYASSAFVEIKSAADLENYNMYIAGDILPYTADEIRQLLTCVNPDASVADIIAYAESYSIQSVMDRRLG